MANISPITRYLVGVGLALWALVIALQPDVGFIAPLPWMSLFWALQISIGIVVLQWILFIITRMKKASRLPLWLLVILSGLMGSLLLAPIFWVIGEGMMEQLLGFAADVDGDTSSWSASTGFGLRAIANEFTDIVGPVTTAWILISWPRLQGLVPPLIESAPVSTNLRNTKSVSDIDDKPVFSAPEWRQSLPSELGDDLIAVVSELQYLRVWTVRGTALVLGSLQDVESQEGKSGVRVHRSWWVNASHVVRIRARGDGGVCELSDGSEVPISRRRKAAVVARFGGGARYRVDASTLSNQSGPED